MNLTTKDISLLQKINSNSKYDKNKNHIQKFKKNGLLVELENGLYLTRKAVFIIDSK